MLRGSPHCVRQGHGACTRHSGPRWLDALCASLVHIWLRGTHRLLVMSGLQPPASKAGNNAIDPQSSNESRQNNDEICVARAAARDRVAGFLSGRRHTIDKETGEKLFPKQAVLALRRAQLPDAAVLRRHAPAYVVLDGRRRGRRATRARRGLPVCQGPGSHGLERPAGEALATSRFSRRRRSLGWPGLLPAADCRRPQDRGRPAGPQVVRHDPGRQGRGSRPGPLLQHGQGHDREGAPSGARHRGVPGCLAEDDRRGGGGERSGRVHGVHRLRMDLGHRRQQPASQRHFPGRREPGPAWSSPSPPRSRSAATIRATSGNTWPTTRRRRAARRSPSPTTATAATAACSRSSSRSPARKSTGNTPRTAGAGNRSTK